MNFIPKLIATITGADRYRPEFEWSNLWIINAWRVGECIFGRRVGIRIESTMVTKSGESTIVSYTLENYLANLEVMLRSYVQKSLPRVQVVRIPDLALAGLARGGRLPFPYAFTIAYGTSTEYGSGDLGTTATSNNVSFTASGANPLIVVGLGSNSGQSINVTGATYNSVALSNFDAKVTFGTLGIFYVWGLANCATGANNLQMTASTSLGNGWNAVAANYSGCNTSGQPNAHTNSTASATSITTTVTTTATTNCWAVSFAWAAGSAPSASTGITGRETAWSKANIVAGDSNGSITPSSTYAMKWSSSGSQVWAQIVVTLAPAPAAAANKVAPWQFSNF